MIRTRNQRRRGGATLVESALLLSLFLMFLMAIFEYSRYLLLTHVATNAARSGARHATVNVDKPDNFLTTNAGSTPSIRQHVIDQMGGTHTLIHNFNVEAFPVEPNGMYQNPPVIAPKPSFTSWKQASFTERIAVRITGQYRPILPGFVFFYTGSNQDVEIRITACSGSEG
jgi:Flp pilus assembly protein TadG